MIPHFRRRLGGVVSGKRAGLALEVPFLRDYRCRIHSSSNFTPSSPGGLIRGHALELDGSSDLQLTRPAFDSFTAIFAFRLDDSGSGPSILSIGSGASDKVICWATGTNVLKVQFKDDIGSLETFTIGDISSEVWYAVGIYHAVNEYGYVTLAADDSGSTIGDILYGSAVYLGSDLGSGTILDGAVRGVAMWDRVLPVDDIRRILRSYYPAVWPDMQQGDL